MFRKNYKTLILVFIFSCLQVQAKEKVTLYLKWFHQYQFAGYYVAQEKGFFAEEGLEVELKERDPKWFPLNEVIKSEGRYAVTDASIVKHYLDDKPVLIVNVIFQHSPLVFATLSKNHYIGPLELKGKKIMYQIGQDDASVEAMFANVGLKKDDFIPVQHTFSLEPLYQGEVDATSVYTTNQPFQMKEDGIDYHLIYPSNYGVDIYGDLLATTTMEAESHPERVKAMRRAVIKGWKYALENFEESLEITARYSKKSKKQLRFEGEETKKLILSDIIEVGFTSPERLSRIARIYTDGKPKKDIDNITFDQFIYSRSLPVLFSKWWKVGAMVLVLILVGFVAFLLFTQKKLKHQARQLEESNALRETFFSNITHELRTPLNGIMGVTENLIDYPHAKDELDEGLRTIQYSSKHLLDIVNDILDLSKMRAQKFNLSERPFSLSKMIDEIERAFRILNKNKKVEFKVQREFPESLKLYADDIRIQQIVNNLLSNAFKFTTEGTIILRVDHNEENEELIISVKDTGIGIKEEDIKNLFLPFNQLHKVHGSSVKGTGLGLSITKELIQMMDGEIKVSSIYGKETTFVVSLPSKITHETIDSQKKVVLDEGAHRLAILLIDDNQINLKMLKKTLNKSGISHVDSELNPKKALELITKNQYDLIITDMVMPEIDGNEVLKFIRTHDDPKVSDTYTVVCSANLEYSDSDEFHFDNRLNKPVQKQELFSILNKLVS